MAGQRRRKSGKPDGPQRPAPLHIGCNVTLHFLLGAPLHLWQTCPPRTKPTMQIRFLPLRLGTAATTILCAIFLAFSAAPNARAAGNIFEHMIPTDPIEPNFWSGFYAGINFGGSWNNFDIGK